MTKYLRLRVKSLLTNPHLLGWGVLFIEFWVFLWIFVFTPSELGGCMEALVVNSAVAMAYLGMISLSSIAVSLTYDIFWASAAARYVSRFTRLSSRRYALEEFASALAVILLASGVIYGSLMLANYIKFEALPTPRRPLLALLDLLAAGILVYLIARTFAHLLLALRISRGLTLLGFVPLLLGFIAYANIYVDSGYWFAHLYPLIAIANILVYHYSGMLPPTGDYAHWFATNLQKPERLINVRLAVASVAAWIIVLYVISTLLLRRIRAVPIQELRL